MTLLYFGAPQHIFDRFAMMSCHTAWKDILTEPYLLFDVLFDELHGIFDTAVWEMSRAVNPEEKMALERANAIAKPGNTLSSQRIQNLHNIQKYHMCRNIMFNLH